MAAARPRRASSISDRLITSIARTGSVLDLPADERAWLPTEPRSRRHKPGATVGKAIRIPQSHANRVLKGVIRFVADVPAASSLAVVWQNGRDELWVDAGSIELRCTSGLITVRLLVDCDQIDDPSMVAVPFATGDESKPRGLLMSTFDRVEAPAEIGEGWSDAIVAFCWEALLEMTRRICADVGKDQQGLPLIPGDIASENELLLVQPMARHRLGALDG